MKTKITDTAGILYHTRCYLIGHMQYQNGEGWRNQVKDDLAHVGIQFFDPYYKPFMGDYEEDEETRQNLLKWMENKQYDDVADHMKRVRSTDLRLCDICDFFICYINPSVASWGSAEEITTCVKMKKPVFIAVEGGKEKTPLWLLGMIPHNYFHDSIEDIITMVDEIDKGEREIDSDRWRLLTYDYR